MLDQTTADSLVSMLQEDQRELRLFRDKKISKEEILSSINRRLERLKEILETGFPNKNRVGAEAYKAAVVITLHTSDLSFLRNFLKLHEEQSPDTVDVQDRALLIDKILVAEGKPQRYGTQYQGIENGKVIFLPIESPDSVDERRKGLSLPSLREYEDFILSSVRR